MHAVVTSAEIHGSYRQAFHDGLHLIQEETIRTSRIAVAKSAGEITLVGKAEPERNTGIRCLHDARSGGRRLSYVIHAPCFSAGLTETTSARCARQCV